MLEKRRCRIVAAATMVTDDVAAAERQTPRRPVGHSESRKAAKAAISWSVKTRPFMALSIVPRSLTSRFPRPARLPANPDVS
jgi:hypothetical protein